jgi:DNA-binding CsgD family transcriptional regulator
VAALAQVAARTGLPEALAALGAGLGESALLDGDATTAASHFAGAMGLLATRDLPMERAEIGRRAGLALLMAGRRDEGVAALVEAHRVARRLGAAPLAATVAAELRAHGEPVERRLGRRAAARLATAGLTRRELEILRLVAAGRTSREIAAELFLSPRTIEMHVSGVLAKLDSRTRAEAAHRAASLGLLGPAVGHDPAATAPARS